MKLEIHWSEHAAWAICLSTMFLAVMGAIAAVAWGDASKVTSCHQAQAVAYASPIASVAASAPKCGE